MKFSAILRVNSYVDRTWKAQGRLGGVLASTTFRLIRDPSGPHYESTSDDLTADAVEHLKLHPDIDLVVTGVSANADVSKPIAPGKVSPPAPVTPAVAPEPAATEPAATSNA
jgi:hypothetical protein